MSVADYLREFDWGVAPTPMDVMEKALAEIASYNPDELREWEDDNAADMCELARAALEKARRVVVQIVHIDGTAATYYVADDGAGGFAALLVRRYGPMEARA